MSSGGGRDVIDVGKDLGDWETYKLQNGVREPQMASHVKQRRELDLRSATHLDR